LFTRQLRIFELSALHVQKAHIDALNARICEHLRSDRLALQRTAPFRRSIHAEYGEPQDRTALQGDGMRADPLYLAWAN